MRKKKDELDLQVHQQAYHFQIASQSSLCVFSLFYVLYCLNSTDLYGLLRFNLFPRVINLSTAMISRSQPTTPASDFPSHRSSFRLPANSNPRFSDFPSNEPFSLSTSDR